MNDFVKKSDIKKFDGRVTKKVKDWLIQNPGVYILIKQIFELPKKRRTQIIEEIQNFVEKSLLKTSGPKIGRNKKC